MKLNSKKALSPIGIAIAIVCLLGVVMVVTAPMIADKYSPNGASAPQRAQVNIYDLQERVDGLASRVQAAEDKARMLENEIRNNSSIQNSYSCTMEGVVDAEGNFTALSAANSSNAETRYVFVCAKR